MERPDFVAFTGDMVTGYNWDGTQGWFERQWKVFTKVVTENKIPYAYTLGNHDVEVSGNRCFLKFLGRPESRTDCPFGPDKPPQPHRVRSGRSTQLHELRNSSIQLYKCLESGNEPLVLRLWESWMQRRGYGHVRLHRTRCSGVVQATIG